MTKRKPWWQKPRDEADENQVDKAGYPSWKQFTIPILQSISRCRAATARGLYPGEAYDQDRGRAIRTG